MEVAIITGVSKGLGEAVATLFLESGVPVIGVSRTENKTLTELARAHDIHYKHIAGNLMEQAQVDHVIEKVTAKLQDFQPATVYLINNAATVTPVNQSDQIDPHELQKHIQLNLSVPMMMTNSFIRSANALKAKLVGVTITSGAAERPIFGWSAYCTTKAGVNMYTKTAALEQEEAGSGHKIIAFNPGIMDTEMQAKIRQHTVEEFIDIDQFKAYKENHLLQDPEHVARVLYSILQNDGAIVNGYIYNVSDF